MAEQVVYQPIAILHNEDGSIASIRIARITVLLIDDAPLSKCTKDDAFEKINGGSLYANFTELHFSRVLHTDILHLDYAAAEQRKFITRTKDGLFTLYGVEIVPHILADNNVFNSAIAPVCSIVADTSLFKHARNQLEAGLPFCVVEYTGEWVVFSSGEYIKGVLPLELAMPQYVDKQVYTAVMHRCLDKQSRLGSLVSLRLLRSDIDLLRAESSWLNIYFAANTLRLWLRRKRLVNYKFTIVSEFSTRQNTLRDEMASARELLAKQDKGRYSTDDVTLRYMHNVRIPKQHMYTLTTEADVVTVGEEFDICEISYPDTSGGIPKVPYKLLLAKTIWLLRLICNSSYGVDLKLAAPISDVNIVVNRGRLRSYLLPQRSTVVSGTSMYLEIHNVEYEQGIIDAVSLAVDSLYWYVRLAGTPSSVLNIPATAETNLTQILTEPKFRINVLPVRRIKAAASKANVQLCLKQNLEALQYKPAEVYVSLQGINKSGSAVIDKGIYYSSKDFVVNPEQLQRASTYILDVPCMHTLDVYAMHGHTDYLSGNDDSLKTLNIVTDASLLYYKMRLFKKSALYAYRKACSENQAVSFYELHIQKSVEVCCIDFNSPIYATKVEKDLVECAAPFMHIYLHASVDKLYISQVTEASIATGTLKMLMMTIAQGGLKNMQIHVKKGTAHKLIDSSLVYAKDLASKYSSKRAPHAIGGCRTHGLYRVNWQFALKDYAQFLRSIIVEDL